MVNIDKKELKREFEKNWEKHYKINALIEKGFKRQQCKKCKRYFWAIEEREFCSDPSCIGYQFIGNSPVKRELSYVETWREIEKYFVKNNHKSIKPFPTVARWRDDLYFTLASINDFQPYVVNGEIEPIANPLIVPQPCIRFNDIDNVGITGRHYTNFVMIGQHAFNTEKTGLFYWKEEAIEHDIGYLTYLGFPLNEIVFHEDVWAGGGNFGPSMEYFVKGLELGNCVFMQYEILPDGRRRELKTKVIDMGAGLSRFAWILRDDPTSYEVVFGKAIEYLKKENSITYDKKLFLEYAKLSGVLNLDEVGDIEKVKKQIFSKLGISEEEFNKQFKPLQSLYAIADHSLTLLFTIRDGMMPSNSGGGYNLRTIARRMFSFIEEYSFEVDWNKLLNYHMDNLKGLFDEYREAVDVVSDVIDEEKKKYENQKQKARKRAISIIKSKKQLSVEKLIELYKSEGILPEHLKKFGEENGVKVEIPPNFYKLVREESKNAVKKEIGVDVINYPRTEKLYYKKPAIKEFEAVVLGIERDYVILDKTAFYPEGGGQVGDRGYLNEVRVVDTKKKDDVVLHIVKDSSMLKVGQKVKGKIDWQRRINISRHHTVTHILTYVAREVLGKHVWQAGTKKDEEKAHIDLTHYKRISPEELYEIEKRVNEEILKNHPIIIEELKRNLAEEKYGFSIYQGGAVPGKNLRLVKIGNIDVEACGGTHNVFNSTSEIGAFKIIKREGIKDGVERITYKAGIKAIEYIQEIERILRDSASIFSVNFDKLPSVSLRFFNEWKKQREELKNLREKLKDELLRKSKKFKGISLVFAHSLGEDTIMMFLKENEILASNGFVIVLNTRNETIEKKFREKLSERKKTNVYGKNGRIIIKTTDKITESEILKILEEV